MKYNNWLVLCISVSMSLNMLQFYQQFVATNENSTQVKPRPLKDDEGKNAGDFQFTSRDIDNARQAAKMDGKIDAILMMQNSPAKLTEEEVEKIIDLGTKSPIDLEKNFNFLSLLSQASFHKGLHSGLDQSEKLANAEYERGYHKALEDGTCPAIGEPVPKAKIVPKIQKSDK
jgi:hypothetical protein